MPTETIRLLADTIDDAAEQIIHLLEGANNRRDVIYFHGWFGWGASAVLKAVVRQLRSSSGLADTRTARAMEKIIHVDVSQWQSKRALQKVIAEELELPPQVMAFFDQHEEEDDFDGVEQSSRGPISQVKVAIMKELVDCSFLVVLHNGSGSYIDLWEMGVPVIEQSSKRVLWTSRGRFWHHATQASHEEHVQTFDKFSDVAISAFPSNYEEGEDAITDSMSRIMYSEAEEVAKYTNVPNPDMSPKIVMECIFYRALNNHNISWDSHASNYWVCDGIIQGATNSCRSAWEIGDALQRNVNLDLCNWCVGRICVVLGREQQRYNDRWVSVTSKNSKFHASATSFFWAVDRPSTDHNGTTKILEASLFEHSDRSSLHVIHLSHCTFSFSSPPFLSCSNLRFLLLDHCKDKDAQDRGEEECNQDSGACFRNLWVLELSYTNWYWLLSKDMLDLMADLRELNIKGFGNQSMQHLHRCSGSASNDRRLVKLRVVAESNKKDDDNGASSDTNEAVFPVVESFPDLSSWHILKTIILDGCGDLELIDCNALPLSLESFTLISSSVTGSSKIKSISFRRCAKLKSLLLRGLFDSLLELDISGTTIKTLDLSAIRAKGLRRLFLLGCEKLSAILWPQEKDKEILLEVLRIDTTSSSSSSSSSFHVAWDREEGKSSKQQQQAAASNNTSEELLYGTMYGNDRALTSTDSYISIRDPRLFRSLMSLRHGKELHVEISSTQPCHKGTAGQGTNTSGGRGSAAVNAHKPDDGGLYADDITISSSNGSDSQADDDANRDVFKVLVMRSKGLWGCPPIPTYPDMANCYISIQDEIQTKLLLQGGTATSTTQLINRATTLPALVSTKAKTLHLHDSLSIKCLPGPAPAADADLDWDELEWCRLERCPNLEGVVFTPQKDEKYEIDISNTIFWCLQTFWASQLPKARYIWNWSTTSLVRPGFRAFEDLVFIHLDYCPRLVHVLPLYTSNTKGCGSLKTLEIVCCGNLKEVFPSDSKSQQQEEPREFPSLKRIHLYELPKLQGICGHRMLAPKLKTLKIRGCWSLKRLPATRAEVKSDLAEAKSSDDESSEDITALSTVDLDCEKEWWDNLEWDGKRDGHHPSHYKPTYSGYNRKNLLRASVLR